MTGQLPRRLARAASDVGAADAWVARSLAGLQRSRGSFMTVSHSVALLGFGPFERSALASAFQMSMLRDVGYRLVERLEDSHFAVVDADGPDAADTCRQGQRLRDTVFVGAQAPAGARSWLMRPLDAARVLQELDLMSARARSLPAPDDDPSRITVPLALAGWPLPARRVLSPGGGPVPSEALGRRLGDALGAVPQPGRPDRRA
jgi:hypothetical protein